MSPLPVLSQVWGRVAWAGFADHLDVLGHFPGDVVARPFWASIFGKKAKLEAIDNAAGAGGGVPDPVADARHVDWLRSGAGFDERTFGILMDALASGMLGAC